MFATTVWNSLPRKISLLFESVVFETGSDDSRIVEEAPEISFLRFEDWLSSSSLSERVINWNSADETNELCKVEPSVKSRNKFFINLV